MQFKHYFLYEKNCNNNMLRRKILLEWVFKNKKIDLRVKNIKDKVRVKEMQTFFSYISKVWLQFEVAIFLLIWKISLKKTRQ